MTDQEKTELDQINQKLDTLTQKVELIAQEQAQSQKWQDRTWDVIKWVGGISAGLSISAAIALVGIVLKTILSQ